MTHDGAGVGLLVESHMGRPVKVEGNPLHPAVPEIMRAANEAAGDKQMRFGATDAYSQAVMLSLYDPDRSQTVLRNGQINTWETFVTELRVQLEQLAPQGGRGLRILTETVVSPTLADQIAAVARKISERRVASVRADEQRQRAARQPNGVRGGRGTAVPRRAGGRDSVARRRFPGRWADASAECAWLRAVAEGRSGARRGEHESACTRWRRVRR